MPMRRVKPRLVDAVATGHVFASHALPRATIRVWRHLRPSDSRRLPEARRACARLDDYPCPFARRRFRATSRDHSRRLPLYGHVRSERHPNRRRSPSHPSDFAVPTMPKPRECDSASPPDSSPSPATGPIDTVRSRDDFPIRSGIITVRSGSRRRTRPRLAKATIPPASSTATSSPCDWSSRLRAPSHPYRVRATTQREPRPLSCHRDQRNQYASVSALSARQVPSGTVPVTATGPIVDRPTSCPSDNPIRPEP